MHEYQLEAQFRCSGSEAFVNWIDNTLGIRRTANVIWEQKEELDFRIFDSPGKLEQAKRDHAKAGSTAKMTPASVGRGLILMEVPNCSSEAFA